MNRIIRSVSVAFVALATILGSSVPASAAGTVTPGHSAYPKHGTKTVGSGIDAAQQNAQLAERLPATIKKAWRAAPPLCPNAGNDDLFSTSTVGSITVAFDKQYRCAYLSAYRSSSGKFVWRKKFNGVGIALVSDGTNVYFLHDDLITAYRASTGKRLWQTGSGGDSNTISVGSGVLVRGESIYSAKTGKYLARGAARITGGSSIVVGKTIYYQTTGSVEAWTLSGASRWAYLGAGDGTVPALHKGVVYAGGGPATGDGPSSTVALKASTGALVRLLPAHSAPLAFDGNVGIFTDGNQLTATTVSAVDLSTGQPYWTRTMPAASGVYPGLTDSSPVIENGLVWLYLVTTIGDRGVLTALRETMGATASRTHSPCNVGSGSGSIGMAQHRLYVNSGCGIIAYRAK